MTTFDDFIKNAETLAKTAAEAARRAAEVTSLSVQIAAEEDRLKSAYADLGRLTYEAISQGQDLSDYEVEQKMAAIRGHMRKIQELRNRKAGSQGQSSSQKAAPEEDFVELAEY